ncbi:hypothetical protein JD844_000349 [Phrynosoma platyrhinos]|uniref:Unconventional prefoldin RPB5 interactor n=1 Tax=Phrynosoma platyrhinos TaxID=52577 RepID=A0ABQ7SQF5_PHRPL|nr:hypothetical protein JD844_000349 [Phrynosoma platyrhinos]
MSLKTVHLISELRLHSGSQLWKKVEGDYEALQERLSTLPDKLSYDIMVPFGPHAFMPGRLVHTNEITVLLGDNWFAKCSAKQASDLVEHRKKRSLEISHLKPAQKRSPSLAVLEGQEEHMKEKKKKSRYEELLSELILIPLAQVRRVGVDPMASGLTPSVPPSILNVPETHERLSPGAAELQQMPSFKILDPSIHSNNSNNWIAKTDQTMQWYECLPHTDVRKTLDDLQKVMKNFESRVEFTEDLQKMSNAAGDFVDIREVIESNGIETKGKHRTAHKPHSKPKTLAFEAKLQENGTDEKSTGNFKSEEEFWARLDELERQEEILSELERISDTVQANGEDASSSEEEKEDNKTNVNMVHEENESNTQGNFQKEVANSELFRDQVNGPVHCCSDEEEDLAIAEDAIPTIYFSHTVEPKRVRINTGKNTTLKFSEKKEEAKRKRKNSNGNGHLSTELPSIKTPADVYRVFVDVVNGEYVPRKSILKSRSRENSVCSDTSESSTAEFDDRRGILRSVSYDEAIYSDNSEGILEEEEEGEQEHLSKKSSLSSGIYEAFSGTVVEKEPLSPASVPHPVIAHPVLPTIPERKFEEVLSEASEESTKRVSKFKAARMQQKT